MAGPILTRVIPPAPPPAPSKYPLRIIWRDYTGHEWDLQDWESGVSLMSGVEGFHNPKIDRFTSTSMMVPGQRARGWQAQPRDVYWPIWVWADSTDEWLRRQAAFFDTIHPDRPGTLEVTAGGVTRKLQLVGTMTDGYQYERDPLWRGWALYQVTLVADQPYWEGAPVTGGPWKNTVAGVGFFKGPPFHLGSRATLTNAQITNPGDVDEYPTWTCTGPLQDIVLGVSGKTIVVPFDLTDGQKLIIDTDPRHQTATRDGADVRSLLGLQSYGVVPSKKTTPLTITAADVGPVEIALQSHYFRAF